MTGSDGSETVFVSYTQVDEQTAAWIAWHLEEAGYSVIYQGWGDLSGNWVLAMDRAMREADRTVFVMSAESLGASYTKPEIANALRSDPTGEGGQLVPVRIESVDPEGWLAQVPYVDLVGIDSEEEALAALLNGVRGGRSKPDAAPGYPFAAEKEAPVHRVVTVPPPFPADRIDRDYFDAVRRRLAAWRGRYAADIASLREAESIASDLMARRSSHPADVETQVMTLAKEVAADLRALPIRLLRRCRPYGLYLHGAVHSGVAMEIVGTTTASSRPEADRELVDRRYDFENAVRVLSAAIEIADFDISSLPQGYREPPPAVEFDVRSSIGRAAVIRARDPLALDVIDIETQDRLASFVARDLWLEPHAVRFRADGRIDAVGSDANHLYRWSQSEPLPVAEVEQDRVVLAAALPDDDLEASLVVSGGLLERIGLTGERTTLVDLGDRLDQAVIGPSGDELRVVAATSDHEVVAWSPASDRVVARAASSLWDPIAETYGDGAWGFLKWQQSVSMTTLDGFPCVLLERVCRGGSAFWMLDPISLEPLRAPCFVPFALLGARLTSDRWLVASHMSTNGPGPAVTLWDLHAETWEPAASALDSEQTDTATAVVVSRDADTLATIHMQNEIRPNGNRHLVLCRWPEGAERRLASGAHVGVWPIADP